MFLIQLILALALFGLGMKFLMKFLMNQETDLKDLILCLLFIDNGLGICLWIYFTRN